ncbi:MAG: radical SAM protein [Alphaproteobacteria bacterium]|nr:radical SAM protein [Alphaproteobacteria bacterium]
MNTKRKMFYETVYTAGMCRDGALHSILAQRPYSLVFKTTNWCWNNCAHCCESSGIHNPHTFIPESVIIEYLNQVAKDKNFSRAVVFTGGELMSAYKYAGDKYVPNIVNTALNNGFGVDIKTNAGWVKMPMANKIYRDIEQIVRRGASNKSDIGIKNIVHFQVSLSLDRFHRDALVRNFEFVKHFADKNIPGVAFTIHISSFASDIGMFNNLLDNLANLGTKITEMSEMFSNRSSNDKIYNLNGNVILRYNCATLFDGGRAKSLDNAKHTTFPQFVFLNSDFESLVAFDSRGNVTLGENSGDKISTPWRDKSGKALPLQTIRENLIAETIRAEQDFVKQHRFATFVSRLK